MILGQASSSSSSSSAIVAGVSWIEHALLGTAATALAVICIGGIGYGFLTGRVPVRRAVTVMIGCFIVFGAPNIAAALSGLVSRDGSSDLADRTPHAPRFAAPQWRTTQTAPDPFNPYPGQ